MQQPLPRTAAPTLSTPTFYITGRQPFRPGIILLASLGVAVALSTILSAMRQTAHQHRASDRNASRPASTTPGSPPPDDDKDDPSQIDTIVLGDPADAPVPGKRGDHVSPVHPTILVHLPRFGDQVGLIPDTPAGQLLYRWLAAFNQASDSAISQVLPSAAPVSAVAAEMELRQETGGFSLLSAREVQPGVLVFRLRDQTPLATEVLGTLQVRPDSTPPFIGSFSLRAVPTHHPDAIAGSAPLAPAPLQRIP